MRLKRAARQILYLMATLWVVLLLWAMGRLRTHALADGLALKVAALKVHSFARASHATPALSGSFADRATEPLLALAAAALRSDDVELCRAVRKGEQPYSSVSALCAEALRLASPALEALLLATHAISAAPPEGLGPLDDPRLPLYGEGFSAVRYAGKLAALRIREELARGQTGSAVDTCVDLQGVARDLTYGTGLPGRAAVADLSEVIFFSCVAALQAASPEDQEAAGQKFAVIAQGFSPLTAALSDWGTVELLKTYGPFLGERLAHLPEGARRLAHRGEPPHSFSLKGTFLVKDAWHREQRRMEGLVFAASLSPNKRYPRIAELSRGQHSFNPLAGAPLPDEVLRVCEEDGRARAELRFLQAVTVASAFHARHHAWPSLEVLKTAGGGELTLQTRGPLALLLDDSAPRGGLEVELH